MSIFTKLFNKKPSTLSNPKLLMYSNAIIVDTPKRIKFRFKNKKEFKWRLLSARH